MSKRSFSSRVWVLVFAAAGLLAGSMLSTAADDEQVTDGENQPTGAIDPNSAPSAARLTPAQLDQLTAAIALYPDPLLGSILPAATYPLEVVEAARWLDDPAHAALHGDQLAVAVKSEPWDASVKALLAFPDVLRMMNRNLEWTEQLGDAFLAQQGEVMDSIQRLRREAIAAGTLASTAQQTVGSEGPDVTIEPASPDVIYVPYYSPLLVYGSWPWPEFPPFYVVEPADVYAGLITFGLGIGIVGPLWGWSWNWPAHALIIPNHGHPRPVSSPWKHDPAHRAGVPYRDAAVAQRFLGPGANFRPGFRGYAPETARAPEVPRAPAAPQSPLSRPGNAAGPHLSPRISPRGSAPVFVPRAPPVFESFGRGPQVRGEAARGSSSRSPPRPVPSRPAGGGVRAGGGRH